MKIGSFYYQQEKVKDFVNFFSSDLNFIIVGDFFCYLYCVWCGIVLIFESVFRFGYVFEVFVVDIIDWIEFLNF